MNWVCPGCETRVADTLMVLWVDRASHGPASVGYYARSNLAEHVDLECHQCAEAHDAGMENYHRRYDHQYIPVVLSSSTKSGLVNQILSQIIGTAWGYVPKSDIIKAIKSLQKSA